MGSDYGKAIRIVRSIKGITQTELCKRVKPREMDSSYLSRLEQDGKMNPSLKTIKKIAEALDIPVNVLHMLASSKRDLKEIGKILIQVSDE
ncbi:helix-turn-helix transcriptional regulator [Candidatus Woesearchaeota archaeon]|nr:helix-turn-helix domain-containing protein [bacterium]NQU79164.1 helix-turn-helix transcriptional regulator [Candidatus Woesearchaeota archaeon]